MKKVLSLKKLVIIIFVLVIIGGGYVVYRQVKQNADKKNKETSSQYAACNTDAIGKNLKAHYSFFTSADKAGLSEVITQIKALPDVDKSINCQFVLAKYSSFRGDLAGAISHYDTVIALRENGSKWVDKGLTLETQEKVAALSKTLKDQAAFYKEQQGKFLRQTYPKK